MYNLCNSLLLNEVIIINNSRLFNFINIDLKLAQQLFSSYDEDLKLKNLTLIEDGLSTSNYIVALKNCNKKYLLKLYPNNGGNSEVEFSSYKYASQYVNVPKIHVFDNSKKLIKSDYMIIDYISSITLKEYILKNKEFPTKFAYAIGKSLALLHNKSYSSMCLIDNNLDTKKVLLPISMLNKHYLTGFAGKHINESLKCDINKCILSNKNLLNKLNNNFVYSHGDFNSNNILINTLDNSVWFIDFEYSLAAPIYYDIGKFFRENVFLDKYRTNDVYLSFYNGYNSHAKIKLDDEWIKLSKLMDISTMLALINNENPPKDWVEDIEISIYNSINYINSI
ncbi:phosphotransferase [Clostridium ihumii]